MVFRPSQSCTTITPIQSISVFPKETPHLARRGQSLAPPQPCGALTCFLRVSVQLPILECRTQLTALGSGLFHRYNAFKVYPCCSVGQDSRSFWRLSILPLIYLPTPHLPVSSASVPQAQGGLLAFPGSRGLQDTQLKGWTEDCRTHS